jgi:hypothetical protein
MADNVPITAGVGTTIATDEIGSIHYQINKLAFGPLNTATLVESGTGLPVNVQNASLAVTGTFWQATQPVSGTFWQATQPVSIAATVAVSGPLTDTQLRASAIPVSVAAPSATFNGRAATFRTPGRAGTTGQKLLALHNASGSTKVVHINQVSIDLYQTVVKAVTVPPPVIRVCRFTAVPTNGTALTKVSKDTSLTSNASVTAWADASADGTSSATTLTITIPANSVLTQEFAPRLITAAGYEMADRVELLTDKDVVLRAGEGLVVFLDYTAATQNPITDMWVANCDWYEV